MQQPVQVTFRNMKASDALKALVHKSADELEKLTDRIVVCRIVVEANHKQHHKGNLYHVRIDLTVPGKELVVSREPDEHHEHEDVYVAVSDAFDAMTRQLKEYVDRSQRVVKTHEVPLHGKVSEIHRDKGYGKIESSDGIEVYFHMNSVLNGGFDRLEVGNEVRFAEEAGDKGPQASTVRLVGKHHIVE